MKSPVPQASTLLFNWAGHWAMLVALAAEVGGAVWYVRAARRVGIAGRPWPLGQTASFLAGLVVVAYAVEGGIARYETDNFTLRVVQVLLLTELAPVLLAVGSPFRLALRGAGNRSDRLAGSVLHTSWARAISHPLVALAICMASTYCYLLTPWYRASAAHPLLLLYTDAHLLAVGCLLWWVIVARDALPVPPRTGTRFALVLLTIPFNAFLGLVIASLSRPLYPAGNTLADTQTGGNVLWALAEVFTVAALGLLFVDWARDEEQKAVRADRQLDAALAAGRAVALRSAEPEGEAGPLASEVES